MKIRNVSPMGDKYLPALGVEVAAGAVVDVEDDGLAQSLCEQESEWQAVGKAKSKESD